MATIFRSLTRYTDPPPSPDLTTRAGIISGAVPLGSTTDYAGAYPLAAGTYANKRFRQKVTLVNGAAVILNDCIIDAIDSPAPTTHSGLVENYTSSATVELNRCLLHPNTTNVFWSAGLKGHRIKAYSCEIYDAVDGAQFHGTGGNCEVYACYFHDGPFYSWTPPGGDGQADGKTHNDGVQILAGSNMLITYSVLERFHNSAIQITRSGGATVSGVVIDYNHFDGSGWNNTGYDSGVAVVNISHLAGANLTIDSIVGNRWGPNGAQSAHIYRTTQTTITAKSDNLRTTGAAINDVAY